MPSPTITLTGLHIYPVKSLRGVSLDEAIVSNGRLTGDRDWLLVDAAGRFMHQRDYPQMARCETTIAATGIAVRTDGMPTLEVRRSETGQAAGDALAYVRLWRRSAPVVRVGQEADEWFTEALGVRCRLMAFVPDAPALTVPDYETDSSLQDATPFHLTTEDSLADLNRRMSSPIPMNRFRPNVVVRGALPYAEDQWKRIAIGAMTLRWIKPCTRCVATMTDQETGARARYEPLLALSKYRRDGPEVVFGHYMVADGWSGTLRIGQPVAILG